MRLRCSPGSVEQTSSCHPVEARQYGYGYQANIIRLHDLLYDIIFKTSTPWYERRCGPRRAKTVNGMHQHVPSSWFTALTP
eukprot:25230-Eustigmatos_ZCMA.PRE.1